MKKFAIILAMLLIFTACGENTDDVVDNGITYEGETAEGVTDESVSDETQKELEKVVFVLDWTPNTNHTGIYVADDLEYYKDEGIELEIVQPPEDGAEILVASGKGDIGVSFQDILASAFASDKPLPIKAVAALLQHNTSGIVSRKGEGMDRPKGLEGHKYSTWDWDIEKEILKNVVERDGGDFSKVELIPSTVTDEVSALQSKMTDAIWIYYAWAGTALELANVPIDYFAFKDINPVFDYYTPVLIASDKMIEERPEVLKAFLRATEKGYQYAINHPEEASDILVKADPTLSDSKELVLKSQKWINKEYISDAKRWGEMDPERWNVFFDWLASQEIISKLPENTGFTNDFLP